jgi:hypothetical protein
MKNKEKRKTFFTVLKFVILLQVVLIGIIILIIKLK